MVAPPRCSSTIGVAETAARSGARDRLAVLGKRRAKLPARADAELREHLVQMPFDGAGADEELRADLRVRRPSRARRAICVSWAVRSSRVSKLRLRTVAPVARSSRRARSAKPSMPIESNISYAMLSSPRASTRRLLAAQPLPVEQVGAGELGAHALRPRRSIASRKSASATAPSLRSARERASIPSAQSVPLARAFPASRSRASAREIGASGPRGSLDQLAQAPVVDDDSPILAGSAGRDGAPRRTGLAPLQRTARAYSQMASADALAAGAGLAQRRLDQPLRLAS